MRKLIFLFIFTGLIMSGYSCRRSQMPLPADSVIYLTATPLIIPSGGEALIKVTCIKPTGYPVSDNTVINFTASAGTIEESAETSGGKAEVLFKSPESFSGTAVIKAFSGSVISEPAEILIGTAAAGNIDLYKNPSVLPLRGGYCNLSFVIYDLNGRPLQSVPVELFISEGIIAENKSRVLSDDNGSGVFRFYTERVSTAVVRCGKISSEVTVELTENEAPEAVIVFSPKKPVENQRIYFNGIQSKDDKGIVSYEWDFGDGRTARGVKVSHGYSRQGTYSVILTVRDADGAYHSTNVEVSVTEEQDTE